MLSEFFFLRTRQTRRVLPSQLKVSFQVFVISMTPVSIRDSSRLFQNAAIALLRMCRLSNSDTGTKRPEAAAGDVPGSQEQEKTESGHKLQGGGLAIAPKRRLWPAHYVIISLAAVLSLSILSVWLFRSRGILPRASDLWPCFRWKTSLAMRHRITSLTA